MQCSPSGSKIITIFLNRWRVSYKWKINKFYRFTENATSDKTGRYFLWTFIMETKRRLRYEREAACVQEMSARTEEWRSFLWGSVTLYSAYGWRAESRSADLWEKAWHMQLLWTIDEWDVQALRMLCGTAGCTEGAKMSGSAGKMGGAEMRDGLKERLLNKVKVTDKFWWGYQELVMDTVIPYQKKILNDEIPGVEKSHALANFRIAAGLEEGE